MADLSSNIEWKRWGQLDPFWSVVNWKNKQKGGASPWTAEEFYAVGASDWRDFERHWAQYGFDRRSCLEIGCGVGRITRHLAHSFERVEGVDVSEHMIELARQAVGGPDVEFFVTDGLHLPQSDASMHAVFSTHVIQHVDDTEIGYSYFREFFRVLKPGGTLMIHIPVHQFPDDSRAERLMRPAYKLCRAIGRLRANWKRRIGANLMRWTSWPVPELSRELSRIGFGNIEFRIISVASNGAPYSFVFATKPD